MNDLATCWINLLICNVQDSRMVHRIPTTTKSRGVRFERVITVNIFAPVRPVGPQAITAVYILRNSQMIFIRHFQCSFLFFPGRVRLLSSRPFFFFFILLSIILSLAQCAFQCQHFHPCKSLKK